PRLCRTRSPVLRSRRTMLARCPCCLPLRNVLEACAISFINLAETATAGALCYRVAAKAIAGMKIRWAHARVGSSRPHHLHDDFRFHIPARERALRDKILIALVVVAGVLSLGHFIDHFVRGDAPWPPNAETIPFLVLMAIIYTIAGGGLYLYWTNRIGPGFWA